MHARSFMRLPVGAELYDKVTEEVYKVTGKPYVFDGDACVEVYGQYSRGTTVSHRDVYRKNKSAPCYGTGTHDYRRFLTVVDGFDNLYNKVKCKCCGSIDLWPQRDRKGYPKVMAR